MTRMRLTQTKWFVYFLARAIHPIRMNESGCTQEPPDGGFQGIKPPLQTPFLNLDPFQCLHRVKHVARVRVNGKSCTGFRLHHHPVQVDGVQGYDEDQIALVILDTSNFTAQVPVILGTPTISHIVNVMKEKEIDTLVMPCANARVAHLLLVCRMTAVKVGDAA